MSFTKGHPFFPGGERGWFKKGIVPWSKGQKGVTLNTGRTHFKKGERAPNWNGYKKGHQPANWKGDNVGYFALHAWLSRKLGQPKKCDKCGTMVSKRYEWANVSKEYKRNLSDWTRLCSECHHEFDDIGNKIWASRRKNGTANYKK